MDAPAHSDPTPAPAPTAAPVPVYRKFPREMIVAPIAGLFMAAGTAFVRIGDAFYTKFKHSHAGDTLSEVRYRCNDALSHFWHIDNPVAADFAAARDKVNALHSDYHRAGSLFNGIQAIKNITLEEIDALAANGLQGKRAVDCTRRIENVYTQHFDRLTEIEGFASKGMTKHLSGLLQRWNYLGHDTKFSIISTAAISGLLALGSLFLFGQNRRLRGEIRDIDMRLAEPPATPRFVGLLDVAPAATPDDKRTPHTNVYKEHLHHDGMTAAASAHQLGT